MHSSISMTLPTILSFVNNLRFIEDLSDLRIRCDNVPSLRALRVTGVQRVGWVGCECSVGEEEQVRDNGPSDWPLSTALSTHLKKVAVPCSLPASYILSSESPWGVLSTAGP